MVHALGGTSVNMGKGRPQPCGFVVHLINQGVFREGGSPPWNCLPPPPLKIRRSPQNRMLMHESFTRNCSISQNTTTNFIYTCTYSKFTLAPSNLPTSHLPPPPPLIYIVSNCACGRDSYFGHHGYSVHIYSMFTYQQVYLYICS